MEKLEELDQALFLFLNRLHQEWLDPVMELFSGKFLPLPFYIFLLFLLFKKFGIKHTLILFPFIALLVLFADQGTNFFKHTVGRYRPCHNEDLKHLVYSAGHCGGIYGFFSAHAANSAAVATFVGLLLSSTYRWIWPVLMIWVLGVGYSRIYFGVHYPGDIIAGWTYGILCGLLILGFYKFVKRKWLPTL